MLAQDVGSDIKRRHAIPIARLTRDQLQVVVFFDRLGESFNALPRIGRARLTFNLGDFAAVRVELVEEFRRLGPDGDLVGSDVRAGAFGSRIIDDNGREYYFSWPLWIAGTKFESDCGEIKRAAGFWDRIV